MKRFGRAFALSMMILVPVAEAGVVERACLHARRAAANTRLCGCVDQVAKATLTSSERRRASKFFRDPELAEQTRMSKKTRDDEFWDKYKAFGARAEATCR